MKHLLLLGLCVWSCRKDAPPGGCTPEGGLTCAANAVQVCASGAVVEGVPCPGGCTESGGVVRCVTDRNTLTAPVGAVCQPGMVVCSHTSTELLTCVDGRLAAGAVCPKGCVDEGEGRAIYCLDANEGIRFPSGFPCPGFRTGATDGRERACGTDGQTLLVCEGGTLVPEERRCQECIQTRSGTVSCLTTEGEVLAL